MKFLDTNISTEDFVSSLRNVKNNLPDIIAGWDSLDDQLKEEYLSQLFWMLNKAAEYIEQK